MGFPTDWLGRPLKELSGGWRMRAILGRLLLMAPDLLLLDEPTNHLDLPTIQWLEGYLQEYQGTYVIVSHDRYFLNRTVNRIAEVAHQQIFHYKGNFNNYLEQKEERDELLQRQFENQQDFIKQQMNFISRFRYKASKAAAVQSRVKQLEKMDRIELQEKETRDFDIKFNIRIKSGKVVVDLKDVGKSYGDLEILQNAEAQVIRGDKIALIGANGKGKSTLLRMLVGNEPHTGSIEEGWNVESAFFAQHQLEALNLKNDLLNEIGTVSSEYTEKELRTVLGCFLFTGEDVFKKVKVLSGGEKSRLALAKTLITQSNFLLLDEPTNHLDMFSSSVLAESLDNYAGTVLFVSHDRTFISRVATKVWWIEDGKIKEYPGTYDEYKEWMEKREKVAITSVNSAVQTPQTKKEEVGNDKSKVKPTTVSKNKLRHWEQEMAKFEQKLNTLDETIKKTESQLLEPEIASDADKVWELTQEHQKWSNERESIQKQHDEIMEQWIDAQ